MRHPQPMRRIRPARPDRPLWLALRMQPCNRRPTHRRMTFGLPRAPLPIRILSRRRFPHLIPSRRLLRWLKSHPHRSRNNQNRHHPSPRWRRSLHLPHQRYRTLRRRCIRDRQSRLRHRRHRPSCCPPSRHPGRSHLTYHRHHNRPVRRCRVRNSPCRRHDQARSHTLMLGYHSRFPTHIKRLAIPSPARCREATQDRLIAARHRSIHRHRLHIRQWVRVSINNRAAECMGTPARCQPSRRRYGDANGVNGDGAPVVDSSSAS